MAAVCSAFVSTLCVHAMRRALVASSVASSGISLMKFHERTRDLDARAEVRDCKKYIRP